MDTYVQNLGVLANGAVYVLFVVVVSIVVLVGMTLFVALPKLAANTVAERLERETPRPGEPYTSARKRIDTAAFGVGVLTFVVQWGAVFLCIPFFMKG